MAKVPAGGLLVLTSAGENFELGGTDEKGERPITLNGEVLHTDSVDTSKDAWGVALLEEGRQMLYFPAGCYDPDDARRSKGVVTEIRVAT